jgi:L-threonylcarbamoyladenylate synthase
MEIIGIDPQGRDVPRRALRILRAGGLVAFPTDTYYALGAAALDPTAIARVFAAKRRPAADPLPLLVADRDQWRSAVTEIPAAALRLADRFWPGPLTIVCRRASDLPAALGGGGDTVGVRQPALPIAAALCQELGMPVVGTSANTHGMPAPATAAQVALDLGESVDLILDGGRSSGSRPSTVVDVTRTPPEVVRVGAIPIEALRAVIGEAVMASAAPATR